MTFYTLLHAINILTIMATAFYIKYTILHKPYSLIWSVVFFALGLSSKGVTWFCNNPSFLIRQLLFFVLLLIDITLIGQLIDKSIFHRPIFIMVLGPAGWGLVLLREYFRDRSTDK